MRDVRSRDGFTLEALDEIGKVFDLGVKHFDRDLLSHVQVHTAIDGAESPRGYERVDAIPAR
jgi:hypothetical protein